MANASVITHLGNNSNNNYIIPASLVLLAVAGALFAVLASQHWNSYNSWLNQGSHQFVILAPAGIITTLVFAGLYPKNRDRSLNQKIGMAVTTMVVLAAIAYILSSIHNLDFFQSSWHKYTQLFHSHPIYGIFSVTIPLISFNLLIGAIYYGFCHKKNGEKVAGWTHYLTLPISTYVTEGLAKIFDFEVLRHGTNFMAYNSILQNGADPSKGGTGSTATLSQTEINNPNPDGSYPSTQETCLNHFHVFKDSEAILIDENMNKNPIPILGQIFKRTHTHFHGVVSGISLGKNINHGLLKSISQIFLGIINFFCPILRFIYRKEETEGDKAIFENDPFYHNLAYRTNQKLPNNRIGLIGVLSEASLKDLKRSWSKSPMRVLGGVVQLVAGVALTTLGAGLVL